MRQEAEFRLKSVVALAPQANAGRASSVARRRRSVDVRRVRDERIHSRTSKAKSACGTRLRIGGSGPVRIICPNGSWRIGVVNFRQVAAWGASLRKRSPSCERMRLSNERVAQDAAKNWASRRSWFPVRIA